MSHHHHHHHHRSQHVPPQGMFPGSSSFLIAPESLKPPRLAAQSGRWASEAFTSEFPTPMPIAPNAFASAATAQSDLWRHTATAGQKKMERKDDSTSNAEFAPPPPPLFSARCPVAMQKMRMMRWFQVVEKWCLEPGKRDKERLIVAPPPRPPPFSDVEAVAGPVCDLMSSAPPRRNNEANNRHPSAKSVTRGAPYNYEKWVDRCRIWWRHVVYHHEKLKDLFERQQRESAADDAMHNENGQQQEEGMMSTGRPAESFDCTEGPAATTAPAPSSQQQEFVVEQDQHVNAPRPIETNIPVAISDLVLANCVV